MEERDNIHKDTSIGRIFFLLSSEPVECVCGLYSYSQVKILLLRRRGTRRRSNILESFPNMYNLATMGFG